MCYELFGTYLFAAQKQLVLDFLDGTGVEHEDGMIETPRAPCRTGARSRPR